MQGRIEVARGVATSRSLCVDGIVLSVNKNNAHKKSCTVDYCLKQDIGIT